MLLHCVGYSFVFPFTSYYPVGLQADVPVVSTHCFINPLLRATLSHLPHLYLLWAYWPSFLPCQPVLPLYSLGFLGPFTSSFALFTPMGLLLNSLGFFGSFTTSLPLIILMGLLTIIPAMAALGILNPFISSLLLVIFMGLLAINPSTLAHWSCFLISLPFCPFVFFSSSLLLGFFFCWALYQNWASTFSLLSIWIAPAIHMRILMQYSFASF